MLKPSSFSGKTFGRSTDSTFGSPQSMGGGASAGTNPLPTFNNMLLEDGFIMLLESGDKVLLEQ